MFAEDLAPFFEDMASDATLNGVAVRVLFDKDYQVQDLGGNVAASGPIATLPSASVPPLVTGMVLVHEAITYKVVEPMPDGTGITMLRLRTA